MKKSGPDRRYTEDFRRDAVAQVIKGGRSIGQVARSLEMSAGTLGTWVTRTRRGESLSKAGGGSVSEVQAELTRLRQENARLRLEKEILKKAAAYFAKESM